MTATGLTDLPRPEALERTMRIAAFIALLISAWLWAGPAVLRADIFDGDAAHHVFWLYQYADPTLFPDDITVRYLRTSAPLGYRALYASIAPFYDVLSACEWVSCLLIVVSGAVAWKIGAALAEDEDASFRGLLGVIAYVVLLALSASIDLMPAMAFQRTFAFPLTLLCMYGLISRHYGWVGASWVGAALFYPVLLPVLGLGGALVFVRDMVQTRMMPRAWILNGICGVTALVLALFFIPKAPELGPAYTYAQAIKMPEYGDHGRLQLFWHGSVIGDYLRFHMMGMGWGPFHLAGVLAMVVCAYGLGRRKLIPFAVWALPGIGFALWTAMRLFPEKLMFGLYLPNRHTRWSYGAFAVVAGAAGMYALLKAMQSTTSALSARRIAFGASLAAPLLAFALTLSHYRSLMEQPVNRDLENIYSYLASLPRDTLIAGHPDLTSYVPLRTRHSVVASTETSMPWLTGYYAIVKPRVEALLRAAYATDIRDMDNEMRAYHADVFITGPEVWSATRYLDPYNDMVQSLIRRGRHEGFALLRPPADRILFRSGAYAVLSIAQ